MRVPALLSLLLASVAATASADADDAHPSPRPSGVSALRCGSASYMCALRLGAASAQQLTSDEAAAPPTPSSVCVNLCVKGADPPKSPLPDPAACGPPCGGSTSAAEQCVLAARAAAAKGKPSDLDDSGTALPTLPLTHADFDAVFDSLRPAGQACPLVVE